MLVLYCALLSCSVMSDSVQAHGLQPARFLSSWRSSRQESWNGLLCPPQGVLHNPEFEPRSLKLQTDSLLSELPGKPMNPGVGSQSLLQGIFLTKESNWGLLHCRQIIYQLNYQGSPECLLLFLFSRPVMSESLQLHGLQHTKPHCPSANSCSLCWCDLVQPSHPLMPSSPSALNLSRHQRLFQ